MTLPPVVYSVDELGTLTIRNKNLSPSGRQFAPLRDPKNIGQTQRIKDGFYSKGFKGNRNSTFRNGTQIQQANNTSGSPVAAQDRALNVMQKNIFLAD